MRRFLISIKQNFLIAFVLVCLVSTGFSKGIKSGQTIVKVRGGNQIESVAAEHDLIIVDSIRTKNFYLLAFGPERSVEEVLTALNEDNNVEDATVNALIDLPEVNQISQGFPDENRPVYSDGITPINYYGQEGTYAIGIDSAHALATGLNIVIAVIDNGIDMSHPLMMNANLVNGHDFVDRGSDPSEEEGDIYGHGTFVAGLLLLTAPDASIMPLRAFDGNGIGDQFAVTKAIAWAVRHGADIINMSFGTSEMTNALTEAIDDAYDNGVVMFSASGNDGLEQIQYPAAHPYVMAVSAYDTLEVLAEFSNYGDYIDITAPGVNLYSALAGEYNWGTWSGTSFSAPLVAGTAALVKQLAPEFTPDQIIDHLKYTARTELLSGTVMVPDFQYGYGGINCFNAVTQLSIGDLDASGTRDLNDLTLMVDYITSMDNSNNSGGSGDIEANEFIVKEALIDLNCDGNANVSDISIMVHHVFVKWRSFKPCYSDNNGGNK